MATVRQYMSRLQQVQRYAARAVGADVRRIDYSTRVMAMSQLAVVAVLVKALVDKGLLSDAELDAAFTAGEGVQFDREPREPALAEVP